MEAYIAAKLEIVEFLDDVIAASTKSARYCTDIWEGPHDDEYLAGWVVFYDDGSNEYISGSDKPDVCP